MRAVTQSEGPHFVPSEALTKVQPSLGSQVETWHGSGGAGQRAVAGKWMQPCVESQTSVLHLSWSSQSSQSVRVSV